MGRRAALVPLVLLLLAGLLVWRVRVQERRRHGPSGGSCTVEGTETVVASKIAGRLVELSVEEGDRVKAGQAVGRIDCSDHEAALLLARARHKGAEAQRAVAEAAARQALRSAHVARSQIAVSRAQQRVVTVDRELAARNLDRLVRLQQAGAATQVDYDNTSTRTRNLAEQHGVVGANVATAEAGAHASMAAARTSEVQIAAAEAQVEVARAEVRRAELQVAECLLSAPRDGIVTGRLYEPGAVIGAGARVLSLVDLSVVKLVFYLPNAELGRVAPGAPAELRVDAHPGRVFRGTVRRVASEAEFTPRDVQTREDRDRLVYAVEVQLENRDGALRAGMPGDVVLPGTER